MDDGILFGDSFKDTGIETLYKELARFGMRIKPSKLHVIMEEGIWKRSIKFLGCEYNPFTDEWRGATRNGSKVLIPKAAAGVVSAKDLGPLV